MNVSIYEKRY